MYNIECDGVNICVNGTFECDECVINRRIITLNKPIHKKPKIAPAPAKQFKRRKK